MILLNTACLLCSKSVKVKLL